MKNWRYKARDMAMVYELIEKVANTNQGELRLLENYHWDDERGLIHFRFPDWVMQLTVIFAQLYEGPEHTEVVGNVLTELLTQLNCLHHKDAQLVGETAKFVLLRPAATVH